MLACIATNPAIPPIPCYLFTTQPFGLIRQLAPLLVHMRATLLAAVVASVRAPALLVALSHPSACPALSL